VHKADLRLTRLTVTLTEVKDVSRNTKHGIYLDGHGVNPSGEKERKKEEK